MVATCLKFEASDGQLFSLEESALHRTFRNQARQRWNLLPSEAPSSASCTRLLPATTAIVESGALKEVLGVSKSVCDDVAVASWDAL